MDLLNLKWAISSAPLINADEYHPGQGFFDQLSVDLNQLETPDNLTVCDDTSLADRRLGKYFEKLWCWYFEHSQSYELLYHNLQVNSDGRTLGEIDFILKDRVSQSTIHLELAVKFYLGYGSLIELDSWYGPNKKDRLDLKLTQMDDAQLPLSARPEVEELLKEKGVFIDRRMMIIKGWLFYPRDYTGPSHHRINSSCNRAYHITHHQLAQNVHQNDYRYAFLSKRYWLVPGNFNLTLPDYSYEELFDTNAYYKTNPGLLSVRSNEQEIDRYFLTPDDWSESLVQH